MRSEAAAFDWRDWLGVGQRKGMMAARISGEQRDDLTAAVPSLVAARRRRRADSWTAVLGFVEDVRISSSREVEEGGE